MAQAGYTPISLYYSTTAAAVPTSGNLASGELAINITDGKLYYKSNAGVVTLLAGATAGPAGGSNTQVQFNSSGALAGSANLTFNGTTLTANTIGAFTLSGTIAGGGNQINNVIIGTSTPLAGTFTQLDITAQGTLRLQDTTGGEYVALRAPASLAGNYTLTFPADDGTSGQALITDGSGVLSWSTAASGDVYGPGSSTDNAVARFDSTTGKLLQNSVVIIGDTGDVSGIGTLSATTLTLTNALGTAYGGTGLTSFTSGGVVYASSSSALATGSALTFDGTNLSVNSPSTATTFTLADNAGRTAVFRNSLGTGGPAEIGTTTNHDFYVRAGASAGGLNSLYLQAGGVTGYSLSYAGVSAWSVGGSEQMRLTSTGLGIGTSSPSTKLHINNASATATYLRAENTNGYALFGVDSSGNAYAGAETNDAFGLVTNGTYRLYIEAAGNVGIGTSSPSSKLDVSGVISLQGTTLPSAGTARFFSRSSDSSFYIQTATSGSLYLLDGSQNTMYAATSTSHQWAISNSTKMTLDSAGNLGLGVTPSAWASNQWSVFESAYGGALAFYKASNVPVTVLTSNAYNDGGWKYKTTDPALQYEMDGNVGIHKWYNAASGTAGDAISFTQAMTLDASGNLGIGTSSPSTKLEVAGNIKLTDTSPDLFFNVSGGANYSFMLAAQENVSDTFEITPSTTAGGSTFTSPVYSVSYAGLHKWFNGSTQAMTLSAGGNLVIGDTSGNGRLSVRDSSAALQEIYTTAGTNYAALEVRNTGGSFYIGRDNSAGSFFGSGTAYASCLYSSGAYPMVFFTNATERARIDSSGNLLVGTTSASALSASGRGLIELNGSSDSVYSYKAGGSLVGYMLGSASEVRIASFTAIPLTFYTNAAERARIDSSGNLLVGTTTKENRGVTLYGTGANGTYIKTTGTTNYWITNDGAGTGAGIIATIYNDTSIAGTISVLSNTTAYTSISDYRLKENVQPMTGALAKVSQLKPVTYTWKVDGASGQGFIAHELQAIVPDCVVGVKDALDENGNISPQSVDASFLVATLTAAIQEQQAIIESLKARLDAANL